MVILFATMLVVVFSSGAFCSTIGEVKLVFSRYLGMLLHDERVLLLLFLGGVFSVMIMDGGDVCLYSSGVIGSMVLCLQASLSR